MRTIKEVLTEFTDGKTILMSVLADPNGRIIEAVVPPEYNHTDPRIARNTLQFTVILHTAIAIQRDIDEMRREAGVTLLGDVGNIIIRYKTMSNILCKLKKDYGLLLRLPLFSSQKPEVMDIIEKAKAELNDLIK
jgi:hypothetical protein